MELTLKITSYHRLSPEIESTKVVKESLTFGRSANNDWHLPDPEKIISGSHGKIVRDNNKYFLYDNSTNGTFVNFNVSPIGAGNKYEIKQGDVFTIGDFQLEASIDQEVASAQDFSAASSVPPVVPVAIQEPPASATPNFEHNSSECNELNAYMAMPKVSTVDQNVEIPENWDELIQGSGESSNNSPQVDNLQQAPSAVSEPAPISDIRAASHFVEKEQISERQENLPTTESQSERFAQAFLAGMGISEANAKDLATEQVWYEMGKSLNQLFLGVIETQRQRSAVKNQLKLNHTMFQAQMNNPLKFSATIDDVIQNLFIRKSSSFLSYEESIAEVFDGMDYKFV